MFEIEIFGPCLVKKLKWGGPKPSWPPQWLHPYLKYVYFFQMLHENKKKIIKKLKTEGEVSILKKRQRKEKAENTFYQCECK